MRQSVARDAPVRRALHDKKWPREILSVLLAPRISRGHFSFAVFFRVTHDGLSERGSIRSLLTRQIFHQSDFGYRRDNTLLLMNVVLAIFLNDLIVI